MVEIIKIFGVISIIFAVLLGLASLFAFFFMPTLLPLAASALLGGALLIAFARVVELLEQLNEKLKPVQAIAQALEAKYKPASGDEAEPIPKFDPNNPIVDPFASLPHGSRVERHYRRRVAFLPDGSILGETPKGTERFSSFDSWRRAVSE